MKRKVLSVMLVAAMVSSLAACGSSASTTDTTASDTAASTEAAGEDSAAAAVDTSSEDAHTLSVSAWDKNFNIPALEAAAADYKANVDPDFNLVINEVSQSSDVEDAVK